MIWLKARQIGASFAFAYKSYEGALITPRRNQYLLSRTLRQSKELMNKVKMFHEVFRYFGFPRLKRESTLELELYNGSVVLALPADFHTVRGFTGDLILDEFAFHRDPRKIYQAIMPTITRGFRVAIGSTPLGDAGMFYDIWNEKTKEKRVRWLRQHTDIHEAKRAGLEVDIDALKEIASDEDIFAQEYECAFLSDAMSFFPYDLITSCLEDDDGISHLDDPTDLRMPLFLGLDVGRKKDLTVLYGVAQDEHEICHTAVLKRLRKMPMPEQERYLFRTIDPLADDIVGIWVDYTGIGIGLGDSLRERYGSRVHHVHFTSGNKEMIAMAARRAFEERKIRIPEDRLLINAIHAIRKEVTSAGNLRFDADRNEHGHADEFWALGLSMFGARRGSSAMLYT